MALPWSFVSKITNSKHQITNKSQIPIFNRLTLSLSTGDLNILGSFFSKIIGLFEIWDFGYCYLFDI